MIRRAGKSWQPDSSDDKGRIKADQAIQTLLKIWAYLTEFKGWLAMILMMIILSSIFGLLGPYLVGVVIDRFLLFEDYKGLIACLLFLAAVYVLNAVSTILQNYWMVGIAQQTVLKMRNDLFWHLHKLPVSYYVTQQHGEIMSRLTNDIENVSQTLNSSFIQILSSILTFIGMLTMMLWLSPLLTLITLLIVPFMYIGMKWITKRTGGYFKEQQKNLGELNGFIEEAFSGQKMIKAFSQERKINERFLEKSERLKSSGYWAQTYSGFIPKLMNLLNNVSFAVIAGAGGVLAVKGMVSIGVIVTFSEYARQFTRPLNELTNQINMFLSAIAGAERIFQLLEEAVEEEDHNKIALSGIKGDIMFSNVSFSYGKEKKTLTDIHIQISAGEMVALVGPTGAGKTTIVQLLSRFYDPDEGEIFIDGYHVKELKSQELRKHMSFVLQDSFLFEDTIRENIRYGKLNASDSEVEYAAKLANAHSFIMKMPKQYDTLLQQDGGGISQGQKQLISLARAFLADTSLLILDEATSNIDTVTDFKIQEALARLMKGRTSIVIAHRLNTIRRADQIVVISEGKIVETGSHSSLLEKNGFYHDLFYSQFKKELLYSGQ